MPRDIYLSENENLIPIEEGGLWGVVDRVDNNVVIVPPGYDEVSIYSDLIIIKNDENYGFLTVNGEEIAPVAYSDFKVNTALDENSNSILTNIEVLGENGWGLIDAQGKESIPCRFKKIELFGETFAVVKEGGRWGVIDWGKECEEIIPISFEETIIYSDIIVVKDRGKYGFFSYDMRNETPVIYDSYRIGIHHFSDPLIAPRYYVEASTDNNWGVIDSMMGTIIPFEYDDVFVESSLFAVKQRGQYGFFTVDREITTEVIFDSYSILDGSSESSFYVKTSQDNRWGLLNNQLKVVIPFEYDDVFFEPNLIVVKDQDRYGFHSANMTEHTDIIYDDYRIISDNREPSGLVTFYVKACNDNRWGLLDNQLEVVIPFEYDDVYEFQENFAAVKKDNLWGFINMDGGVAIEYKYENVKSFSRGTAEVQSEGSWGLIDTDGNAVVPCIYDELVFLFHSNHIMVCLDGRYGIINKEGEVILECNYDLIEEDFGPGYIIVLDNKYGIADFNGEVLVDCKYDYIFTQLYGYDRREARSSISPDTFKQIDDLFDVAAADAIEHSEMDETYETNLLPVAYIKLGNREGILYRDYSEYWFED